MTVDSRGTPRSTAGSHVEERIRHHQQVGEILRARSVLLVACSLWLACGLSLDLLTHAAVGTGPLGFVVVVRLATSAFHAIVMLQLFRAPPPSPRYAAVLVHSVFPVSSFALVLIATHMGGLTSAYVTAVFVVSMGQTITWPSPWRRGALLVGASAFVFPIGLLIATRFDPQLEAQLHDARSLAVFATYAAVLGAGAIIAVWGGHVMWSLRQSVFESRKLGRYRLLQRIGRGGMGEVWRAEDRALHRTVALKILSPEHGRKPSLVARFEREIQATAAISHPNVVRIHDWGVTDDGVWYYAMDLLAGSDLQAVIRGSGPMPPALALHLLLPAANGLAAAHAAGVVHRDVKPANLFVVALDHEPQRIEILDFGIARLGDDADLTQAGSILGTPGFMAPEVAAGALGTIAADIYGFAASLYFALAATTPRDANHAPVSALVTGIPSAIDDVLVRALDADPSRRHATIVDLANELARANLAWTGSWSIDTTGTSLSRTLPTLDPTIDSEAPATQLEAREPSASTGMPTQVEGKRP